jgi:hypothetical protein
VIVQRYTFRCDAAGCDVEEEDVTPLNREVPQPLDTWPPKPVLPPGWRLIDEHIVCPAHTLTIDGHVSTYGAFVKP